MVEVTCTCGHCFEADESQVGGIVNCPACRCATPVPGLRDGMWRASQVVGAVVWAFAVAAAYVAGGLATALTVALVGAAIIAVITLAM